MANSILNSQGPATNPASMLQQFNQFRQQMAGRNPQQMLQQMVQSGQISQDQLNGLLQQAQSVVSMFHR